MDELGEDMDQPTVILVILGGTVVAAPRRLRILPLSEFVPTGINPEQARASWVELCAAIESARQDRDCPEVPK